MPAQKRSVNSPIPSDEDNNNNNNSSVQGNQNVDEQPQEQEQEQQSDSDGSSVDDDKDEYITVALADIRKEVQCPICLGIIRKTRTVMECLHRFCRECIDKSMRLGNNECPACRTHCASRRSLRDDPKYDALIAALYPDIDKYEEEELAFHEEERTRYKKIQDSIAETQRRQAEALGKKRTSARATAAAFARRSQAYRSSRGRRNQRAIEQQGSDEEDYANGRDRGKDSSSADEQVTEGKPKKYKRWRGSRNSQTSLVEGNADGGDEDHSEVHKDSLGASAGLAWGSGGMRSNNRHSNMSAGKEKIARSIRLSKLLESFQDTVDVDKMNIHLILFPLDKERLPSLERPYMRCEPTVSVRTLCQHVALNIAAEADDIEILLVQPKAHPGVNIASRPVPIDPSTDVVCILEGHETLAELQAMYSISQRDMGFAYRQKLSASMNSI